MKETQPTQPTPIQEVVVVADKTKAAKKKNKQQIAKRKSESKKVAKRIFTKTGEPVYVIKMKSGNRFLATGKTPKEIRESSIFLLDNQANPSEAKLDTVKYVVPLYDRS